MISGIVSRTSISRQTATSWVLRNITALKLNKYCSHIWRKAIATSHHLLVSFHICPMRQTAHHRKEDCCRLDMGQQTKCINFPKTNYPYFSQVIQVHLYYQRAREITASKKILTCNFFHPVAERQYKTRYCSHAKGKSSSRIPFLAEGLPWNKGCNIIPMTAKSS